MSAHILVEYTELHRALGVSKILVHDLNLNSRLKKILSRYHDTGLVDVLPMKFPGNVSEEMQKARYNHPLYADAQMAVYDCMERLSGYGFIGIIDFDEILDLLSTHENAGSFMFGVEQFIRDWNISNNSTLESMRYIQRMEPDYVRPKLVHIPGRVGMVWTHDASPLWGFKRYRVPFGVATIHHYRTCRFEVRENCSNAPRFSDARLLSLEDAIKHRVQKILEIFP
ncbi:hypothetical protein LOTGIDRAFT_160253 [Lottia gigantea]|uniref:Glycosyltransferase family 92 protein n=1 Tax=Lottia gigantea TaxID=225164 RepID=V4ALR3_LOTGI|nr:hypothetical protein LOTGIDRAFT_160253 [Lottia gigantea]ESO95700.1 hypothetical protein LOTGIDRAFT_160253 [Lottia gigantea]